MTSFFLRGNMLAPGGLLSDHVLEIHGTRIGKIYPAADFKPPAKPLCFDGFLVPGFIDLQVNPAGTWDLPALAKALARQGCTGFLAAIITCEEMALLKRLGDLRVLHGQSTGGAKFLGLHCEGPFLNSKRAGVHPAKLMRRPTPAALKKILKAAGASLKLMTLAPEIAGGLELTRQLVKEGIVASLGHSDATYEEAMKAFDAGARAVTHLFNASSPMHHRAPGLPGAALQRKEVFAQMIPDGLHVHPAALRLAYSLKGPQRLIAVTDALAANKASFEFAGRSVSKKDGCFRSRDGVIAGSALGMAQAWANLTSFVQAPQTDLIQCSTLAPAALLGMDRMLGSLEEGKEADMVVLDEKQSVSATWVSGEQVYVRDHRVYRRV